MRQFERRVRSLERVRPQAKTGLDKLWVGQQEKSACATRPNFHAGRRAYSFFSLLSRCRSRIFLRCTFAALSEFGELYGAVEMSGLFPDQKTFADAIPNEPPSQIVADYEKQKQLPGFDLKAFVAVHFATPREHFEVYKRRPNRSVSDYINDMWQVLRREPDEIEPYSSLLKRFTTLAARRFPRLSSVFVTDAHSKSHLRLDRALYTVFSIRSSELAPRLKSPERDPHGGSDRHHRENQPGKRRARRRRLSLRRHPPS